MRSFLLIYSLLNCLFIADYSNAQQILSAPKSEQTPHKLIITIPKPEQSSPAHAQYFPKLLELALQKTQATDGEFELKQSPENYTSGRQMAELTRNDNTISILWTSTSKMREQHLLPIKVSILRGLNSYRVFLIRSKDQESFHSVHNLEDLRKLRAGQGTQWPDTTIMKHNNLTVVTAAQSQLLFDMLASKRFDYFPRGLYEVWDEQLAYANKGLIVENSLMLHYPAPIYFFVNRSNTELADRIERGLHIAMQDGSFDSLFFSIPGFKKGYEELHQSSRKKIELTPDFFTED